MKKFANKQKKRIKRKIKVHTLVYILEGRPDIQKLTKCIQQVTQMKLKVKNHQKKTEISMMIQS